MIERPAWLSEGLLADFGLGRGESVIEVKRDQVYRVRGEQGDVAVHLCRSSISASHLRAQHAVGTAATLGLIPHTTAAGETIFEHEGRVGDVTSWVDHDAFAGDTRDLRIASCSALARWQDEVGGLAVDAAGGEAPWLGLDRAQSLIDTTGGDLLADASSKGDQARVRDILDDAARWIDRAGTALDEDRTLYELTHGDFGGANALVRDGEVVAIIDLGRLDRRPRLFDLAFTVAFESLRVPVGQTDLAFVASCRAAYEAARPGAISPAEWSTVPLLVVAICAVGIARAATEEDPAAEVLAFGSMLDHVPALIDSHVFS